MNPVKKKHSFPYWVVAIPLACLAFVAIAEELAIDEGIFVPAMIMTIGSLVVISVVRARQRRSLFRSANWGWLIAGPVLLLLVTVLISELSVDEDFYIPAFIATAVVSMYVFTRKPDVETIPEGDDLEARVERLVAAPLAKVNWPRGRRGNSWFWGMVTIVATVGLIVTAGIRSDSRSNDREEAISSYALDDDFGRPGIELQREAQLAMRQAERQIRDLERRVERAQEHPESDEQQWAVLKEEQEKTKQNLVKARLQVAAAKAAAQKNLELARARIEDAIDEGELDIDLRGLSFDASGVAADLIHDAKRMTIRLNGKGLTVESVVEDAESICPDDEWCDAEGGTCELASIESEGKAHVVVNNQSDTAPAIAEVDEESWENDEKWEEVAGKLLTFIQEAAAEEESDDESENDADVVAQDAGQELLGPWKKCSGKPTPQWALDGSDTDGLMHRLVVTTGPCESQAACLDSRATQIDDEVARYTADLVGAKVSLSRPRINEQIVDEYYGIFKSRTEGVGERPVIYTLLEFDKNFQDELVDTYFKQTVVRSRMAQAGIGSFGVLGMLASIFGYLKMDQRTYGRKRGRLKIGTMGVMGVIIALCALGTIFV